MPTIPCRVNFEGQRYRVYGNGLVAPITMTAEGETLGDPVAFALARTIRAHAAMLRAKRNAAENVQERP